MSYKHTSAYTQTKVHATDKDKLRERRVVASENYGAETETFNVLRTKILKQMRENQWNSIGITSPGKGAGKSMIAVNLAIAIAKEANQTVLLVDLDLRYPKIHWYFGMNPEQGLRDYLTSNIPLSEILLHPDIERLVVLPGKGVETGSSELLSTPKMKALAQDINQRYQSRIIIYDLPPILAADDVLISMEYFDAALLVIEEGGSKPEEISKSLQLLSDKNFLGMVLNKAAYTPDIVRYY